MPGAIEGLIAQPPACRQTSLRLSAIPAFDMAAGPSSPLHCRTQATSPTAISSPARFPAMTAQTAFDLIFRNALLRSSADARRYRREGRTYRRDRTSWPARRSRSISAAGWLCPASSTPTSISTRPACSTAAATSRHACATPSARSPAMKRDFTVEDVYARGATVLERASSTARRGCAPMSRSTRASACAASRRSAADARLCLGDRPVDSASSRRRA